MPEPWKVWLIFWFLRLLRTPYNSFFVRYDLNPTIIGLSLLVFLPVNNVWQMSISSRRIVTLSAFPSVITCNISVSRHALRDLLHISRDTLLAVFKNHVRPPCWSLKWLRLRTYNRLRTITWCQESSNPHKLQDLLFRSISTALLTQCSPWEEKTDRSSTRTQTIAAERSSFSWRTFAIAVRVSSRTT